jgi:peroxiredoxin
MEDRSSARLVLTVLVSLVSGAAVFVAALAMMMMISAKVRSAGPTGPMLVGGPAPQFELLDVEGKRKGLSDYQGKPVVLVFWADWCPDCKAIIPELNLMHGRDVTVVGVNLMETRERTVAAIRRDGIRYPVLLDRDGSVGRTYGVQAIPNIFILDEAGQVLEHAYTLPTMESLEWRIRRSSD